MSEEINAGGFFDVGLSDIFGAYVQAETAKAKYSYDANQQGLAQRSAIADPEKQNQNVNTADVTDSAYTNQGAITEEVKNNNMLYIGGGIAALLVLFLVLKS